MLFLAVYVDKISVQEIVKETTVSVEILRIRLKIYDKERK